MGHASEHPGRSGEHDLTELVLRTMMRSLRFIRQIMGPFFEGLGISLSQWIVMRVTLDRENETGTPVRIVDLGRPLTVRPPTLTAVINKLALMGPVERVPAGGRRGARRVRLPREGRSPIDKAVSAHRVNISALFDVWSVKDKGNALELFRRLGDHLMKHAAIGADTGNRKPEL